MLSLDIVYRKSGAETLIVAITLRMPRDSDLLTGPTGDDQGTSNAHESCYPREMKFSTYVGFGEDDQTPIVEADIQ